MSITGKYIRLRAVEEIDLPLVHAWANDEKLWANLGGWRFPSNLDSAKFWLSKLSSDLLNQRFIIEVQSNGRAIGTANLINLDWKNRNCSHGMMIGSDELRRQGFGRDTVMTIMRYVFDELGMERLESDIIEFNDASYRLYVGKCGWTEEGRQRRWHYRQGKFWDRIIVGITRDDYAELVKSTGYWT